MRYLVILFSLASASVAETHEIYPDHHSRVFSAQEKPVLRIHSGDTVITKTWDSGGQDHTGGAISSIPTCTQNPATR